MNLRSDGGRLHDRPGGKRTTRGRGSRHLRVRCLQELGVELKNKISFYAGLEEEKR